MEQEIERLKDIIADKENEISELKKECQDKDEEIERLSDLIKEAYNLSSEIKHILS